MLEIGVFFWHWRRLKFRGLISIQEKSGGRQIWERMGSNTAAGWDQENAEQCEILLCCSQMAVKNNDLQFPALLLFPRERLSPKHQSFKYVKVSNIACLGLVKFSNAHA